jgi:hypothetical protein
MNNIEDALAALTSKDPGPTTAEELRQQTIKNIDAVLQGPWVVTHWLSDTQKRMLQAQRDMWQSPPPDVLAAYWKAYQAE